jgi:hypothetical protein
MTIDFKNLIVGTHESKVLFIWNPGKGVAVLGAFRGIKDGIEAILARDGITPAQRAILEEFRAIAGKNNWDFATLRESLLWLNRQHTMRGCGWAQSDATMAAKLLQSADPIPQRPEIFIVNRQSPNVLIKPNGTPQPTFRPFHAACDARITGKVESDHRNLGMNGLRRHQNGFRLPSLRLTE